MQDKESKSRAARCMWGARIVVARRAANPPYEPLYRSVPQSYDSLREKLVSLRPQREPPTVKESPETENADPMIKGRG
jgi:hypothetical protein